MEDLMKKRLLSLALILVLTLICGVQIAADSAETCLLCNHQWAITYGQYDEHGSEYCHITVYEGIIKTCELCPAVEHPEDGRIYITERYEHLPKVGSDGFVRCYYCRGYL